MICGHSSPAADPATSRAATVWLALATALAPSSAPAQVADAERNLAVAIEREVERMAARGPIWPGYDPLVVPLAVYTGGATFLFRHPAPPEGFAAAPGAEDARVWAGRHPAATSNSSADIGGTVSATILADGERARRPPADLAAVAVHEAFHVYQRARHPGWSGNEGDLVLYPVDNAELLTLRRLESAALRRALAERDSARAACRAASALEYRRARFAAMDSAFVAYERLNELNEGLATWVQLRAAGQSTVEIPEREFAPEEVRLRIYAVGPAFAFLLDRFAPGWRESLEARDTQSLDGMLAMALAGETGNCAIPDREASAIRRDAGRDAAAVVASRAERRRAFDARSGWKVIVQAADGQPLWPQGFDPLNLQLVEGGLLHGRFLRLGNDIGSLEAVDGPGADIEALTLAAGAHPLFNGVSRVTIVVGLRPAVEASEGRVQLRAPGFTATFARATARESDSTVLVDLAASP
ncbi:MAG TPA: hypothetical protein VFN96_09150 [Gemmatimonadales bacterium]|nr:hypothetical protein [Gemmatimonadales bacterium]